LVQLLRRQLLSRIIEIHVFPDKQVEQVRVKMAVLNHKTHDFKRLGQVNRVFVGPVFGGQGFKDVRQRQNA
jgi:hypothetical protein